MPAHPILFYKSNPFLRLLIPLSLGILIQWRFSIRIGVWWLVLLLALAFLLSYFFLPFVNRFRFRFVPGITGALAFISVGAVLVWNKDIRNHKSWIGHLIKSSDQLIVTLDEEIVEKPNSFKTLGIVSGLVRNRIRYPAEGRIILYLKKDPEVSRQRMRRGTKILIVRKTDEIKSVSSPNGFDFKRYCLFRGITHQTYLKPNEFLIVDEKPVFWIDRLLTSIRERVLEIFSKNISGDKERGLAEALLIGHKADLDPGLVTSYTNTGVVHIIAISGMHLGLIYGILLKLFRRARSKIAFRWLQPVGIISGLWTFTLLAGAQPSVTRSALMFTSIVLGGCLARKAPIVNTLGFSAFLLLCYNPFWLWDPGFQLSYSAVLSIVIFQKAIYHWFYFRNKFVDNLWKLNAVTISAQILTTPISIYHFHQFPNYFLLTNLVAVPLSGLIIMIEILLCMLSLISFLPELCGKIVTALIRLMNNCIERIESLPFSVSHGLYISPLQLFLSFLIILGISLWLMDKSKTGLKTALMALCVFCLVHNN
jgi:competence protein ComEC